MAATDSNSGEGQGADHERGPLGGIRVVDLGQYVAGPLTATLLADQGADVIRIDPPSGPRLRTPANAVLLRGRRRVALDLRDPDDLAAAQVLVDAADVLVENFRPGVMDRLGLGADTCLARDPRLIYCSLPGFGAGDARGSMPAWEGTVLAATGVLGGGRRPDPSAQPRCTALPLASNFAAMEAGLAIVAALVARDRGESGQRIEVPLFDAMFEAIGTAGLTMERPPADPPRDRFGGGWYRCADGRQVCLAVSNFRFVEWMAECGGVSWWRDDGLLDKNRLADDAALGQELCRRLAELFLTDDAFAWEARANEAGVPLIAVRSTAEWLAEAQPNVTGALVGTVHPQLGDMVVPGPAVRLSTTPPVRPVLADDEVTPTPTVVAEAKRAADASPRSADDDPSADRLSPRPPLDGFVVLDFTRVLAGPTAARLLGELGATVIKIDVDPAKATYVYQEPFSHGYVNRGKQTACIDLPAGEGDEWFPALLRRADVIIQNFTVGTAARLGIDEPSVRRSNDRVVYVYLNCYGAEGPWAARRGFEHLAQTATGMADRYGDDEPRLQPFSVNDFGTGVLAAFAALVGLHDRITNDRGQSAQASLIRTAQLHQLLYLNDYDGKTWDEPRGTSKGWTALQQLYRAADGWFFLGATPEQLPALFAELGAEAAGNGDDPSERLITVFSALPVEDCMEAIRRAGAGATPLSTVTEIMAPGGVADQRGLRVEQESVVYGRVVAPGPGVRFSRTRMRPGAQPAPAGADTHDLRIPPRPAFTITAPGG